MARSPNRSPVVPSRTGGDGARTEREPVVQSCSPLNLRLDSSLNPWGCQPREGRSGEFLLPSRTKPRRRSPLDRLAITTVRSHLAIRPSPETPISNSKVSLPSLAPLPTVLTSPPTPTMLRPSRPSVLSAGADARIANFLKRGLEFTGLVVLDPMEV